MIARIWHGVTSAARADAYVEFLKRTGVPDYKATDGNQGVYMLRRIEGDRVHFLMVTFWDAVESIQIFAGEDYEKARYYPEDTGFLLELEPNVAHYEVIDIPE